MENKIKALAQHLNVDEEEINEEPWGELECDGGTYNVMTDWEADDAWENYLDSYIDDCILPEMPEHLQGYFDDEKWKRDARIDGRGHCINTYDGSEEEEQVDGEWYYIYRTG